MRNDGKWHSDVHVILHVALERSVMESAVFCIRETWMEHCFRAMEAFGANSEIVSQ